MRLDRYLIENKLFASRARAQAAIAEGLVRIDGVIATKSSQKITESAEITVSGNVHNFVSRGGTKLEAALRKFEFNPAGKICLDLGASTGGFTDVLLRQGAAKVYAVDVGTDQLHETIAGDARVINLQKTHAKDLSRTLIPDPIELIVCDVSFISLKKALPPALALAAPGARLVALIKPQFEVGRSRLGKGGIVKDELAYASARAVSQWLASMPGWKLVGIIDSPVRGGDGNKEYLVAARAA